MGAESLFGELQMSLPKKDHSILKGPIIVVSIMALIGLAIVFFADHSLDWKGLHTQLTTNQTLIKSLDCNSIQKTLNSGSIVLQTTNHQQILNDYKQIAVDKKCSFIIGESK